MLNRKTMFLSTLLAFAPLAASAQDFSATGGDMRFGYMTQNTTIETAISTTSGIDNWSVVVFAPEPPASALLGAALVGLAVATIGRRPCAPRASVEDSRDARSLPPL